MSKDKVAILLSTYNGEQYLKDQIESILHQTHQDFILYIRDDGSTDNTINILDGYSSETIELIKDELGNVGIAKSFRILMESVSAEYYLFADQDDIWELNKLEILFDLAKRSPLKNEPYVLFSNMSVFDENTGEKYDFFKKFKINTEAIEKGLFRGTISGCLMLFNEAAKQRTLATHVNTGMLHDWDVFMTCYLYGEIEMIDQQLIHHRLHDKNAIGQIFELPISVLFKDLIKYCFNSRVYRKIELESYFDYVDACTKIDPQLRLAKELFTENELNELSYFRRKKWYLKHFNPFVYGRMRGLLILLTM
jgi:glycosyltransferase involved in cell wall biosynthesis